MDSSPRRGAPRPLSPRLSPVSPVTDEIEEILTGSIKSVDGEHLRLFGTMAHHPKMLKRFLAFGGFFLNRGLLPAREREIVILRVGWNTGSVYEFGQHTVIGRNCDLTDVEISALAGDPSRHAWSARDRGLIAMTDEICADDCVSDPTWKELRAEWTDAELCELVLLAGLYRMVAGFLNTMGVELDPNTPGWPD
jgi:alkylhydroperoxidase family enzyme